MTDSPMRRAAGVLLLVSSCMGLGSATWADDVVLKNGLILRGAVEKDNTIRMVSDDLKRVFLRDSKIESVTPSSPFTNLERFQIVQPLEVHAGAMPVYAIYLKVGEWNEKGRRSFSYVGPRSSKPVAMTQAMNDLGPYLIRFRGIDGFWVSQVATPQVPKKVILGLLGRVDRKLLNERQRVARFMLQAGWFDEAKHEMEAIAKDFPEEGERSKGVLAAIEELHNRDRRKEMTIRVKAQQPVEVRRRLKEIPTENLPVDLETDLKDFRKKLDEQDAADRKLAETFRETTRNASAQNQATFKAAISEILKTLDEAPDAVRPRLEPFSKAAGTLSPDAKLALAVSGWAVGPERASTEIATASAFWKARGLVRGYLTAKEDAARQVALDELTLLEKPVDPSRSGDSSRLDLDTVSRLIPLMPPPFAPEQVTPGKATTHRVMNDANPEPTEYMLLLPPEYHPFRNYPTIVALHDGAGPKKSIDFWAEQAARHGFIVLAPEYCVTNQPRNYRYSASEHAAIELSLRDARKRYAIDSNRVYLTGNMIGGNAAIDIGFSHPDLFAGMASISGLPSRYAFAYRKNVDNVPIYCALGDLAPGAREVVFEGLLKPMITDTQDVIYAEYIKRGHEDLPEEAETVINWMEKYRRDPAPKAFEVTTARASDARFWGVVVQELSEGRAIAPEAADPLGKNIRGAKITMRSSALSNLLTINAAGVDRLDVWVSPRVIDFKKKFEVRINGRAYFKGQAKPDFGPLLTDLRFRGDRQQLYWLKVAAGR